LKLDLHVHSDRSDGKYPPDEVLRRAAEGGLDVVALSDHDADPALPAGPTRIDGKPLHVIAAAELSGQHAGREFHLLVFFRGDPPPEARRFLRARAQARAERFDTAMARLGAPARAPGDAQRGDRALTRYHMAQALVDSGHVRRPHDAWTRLGSDVVPLIDLGFVDAIRVARSWGAYTSWAHPPLAEAQRHLQAFVAHGLEALEVSRPSHDRATRNGLGRLAKRFSLGITGGSDWHGWWEGELGTFRFEHGPAELFLERLGVAATS
jgi:predicted metal-dependent phosphoesterase TrpH